MTRLMEPRIVVIGAGIAGLAAARALVANGVKPVVLEARQRVGGRIWTDRSLGTPVDMGASWIHGHRGNPITRLAKMSGAATLDSDEAEFPIHSADGTVFAEKLVAQSEKRFAALRRAVEKSARRHHSLLDAIQDVDPDVLDDPLVRLHMAIEIEFDAGGALNALSATEWDKDEKFSGSDLLIPRGYDQIPIHLAQNLNIIFGNPVSKVTVQPNGVSICTGGTEIEADACICTVPLGVLKSSDICFEPGLPKEVLEAIRKIGIGHANKIAFRLQGDWPSGLPLSIGSADGRGGRYPYLMNLDALDPGCGVMVTYAVGAFSESFQNQTDAEVAGDVQKLIDQLFGRGRLRVAEVLVSRWTTDRYSQGSYSFAAVGAGRQDFQAFADFANPRCAFAGEHTHPDYRGTVHGAWLSGEAAAQRILAALTHA